MNAGFTWIDYTVFIIYAVIIVGIGLWVSRVKKGEQRTSSDYFLASRSLKWWAIGASLIAANISAEHFIGMSGSGFRIGLGIAAYEWIAAITLILVAKFLLPLMLEKKIYTMPQLLNERYGNGVSLSFSIFWLMLYLFVNLTSVAWLGALAMEQIMGVPVMWGIVFLLLFSGIYSIYGGLKSVAWTDVIQVVFLIGGGLITAYFALKSAGHGSMIEGLSNVFNFVKDNSGDMHFKMVIPEGSVVTDIATKEKFDIFKNLPGLAMIFGAIWLTNIGYWGFNQYIIQKGLAAKNIHEAKKGLIFAAYLKILIPIIVVIPGITAYVLFNNPELSGTIGNLSGDITKADDAYPWLLRNFTPVGIKGLAFAALVAAVVSSLASMLNSTSTIFTMDIYKQLINKTATEKQLVKVGRIVALIALVVAMFSAKPLLGGLDQAFQYIQEYSGYIYPGVCVVFGMALLWKRATNKAALWTAIVTIPIGIIIKIAFPEMGFQLRMGYVFIILVILSVTISLLDRKHLIKDEDENLANKKSMINGSYLMFLLAGICTILGIIFSKPYSYLAFDAIFTMAAMFAFVGIILLTNAKSRVKDKKAYDYQPELFKMTPGLTLGSIGIVIILVVLYASFW
ncbi:MAG: sodium/glucose cotransporter [Bacteroidetes bacterium GWF2_40_14]|nr:MAG: sodium/glucose cotransporter [Bacteroidetes bacterium GWF2_40_14]